MTSYTVHKILRSLSDIVTYTLVPTSISLFGWDATTNCSYCLIQVGYRRPSPLAIAVWPTWCNSWCGWVFSKHCTGRKGESKGIAITLHDSHHTCFPKSGDMDTDITVIAQIDSLRLNCPTYRNYSIRYGVSFSCPSYHDNYDITSNLILNT
jgi:hypothetical protein